MPGCLRPWSLPRWRLDHSSAMNAPAARVLREGGGADLSLISTKQNRSLPDKPTVQGSAIKKCLEQVDPGRYCTNARTQPLQLFSRSTGRVAWTVHACECVPDQSSKCHGNEEAEEETGKMRERETRSVLGGNMSKAAPCKSAEQT